MFNLEKSIIQWRKSLRKNTYFEDGYVEELESHLRDEIDALTDGGMDEEKAFLQAVEDIGQIDSINEEYYKTDTKRISGKIPTDYNKWIPPVFSNYFKIAFRHLWHHKGYSFINLSGLVIGLICTILIMLWIQDELSYDDFHNNANHLFRVAMEGETSHGFERIPITPAPLATVLKSEYPEIKKATRVYTQSSKVIKYKDKKFGNDRITLADPQFLEMFSFPLIKGDPKTALLNKHSALITQSIVKKYFEDENPIGEILNIDQIDYTVTGILEDIPHNSHIQFDVLLPFASYLKPGSMTEENNWGMCAFSTYVLLDNTSNPQEFSRNIAELRKKHLPESSFDLFLEPIKDIHLYHDFMIYVDSRENAGDIKYIYIFSAMAIFILLIACINFMNLTTARSSSRIKEVGMRKVIGAGKIDLIRQFLGESVAFTLISLIIALISVQFILPYFAVWAGKPLHLNLFTNLKTIAGLFLILFITGILSGSYPAFYLSSFKPVKVLKGITASGSGNLFLRKTLVVIQFAISISLIVGALVINKQLEYTQNANLGYNKDQIIYINADKQVNNKFDLIKDELEKNANIFKVSRGSMPIESFTGTGNWNWEGKDPNLQVTLHPMLIGYDYVDLMGMEVKDGRNFSKDFPSDMENSFLVNEAAIKVMEMSSPIGKTIYLGRQEGTITGVIKDFHYGSLHSEIGPVMLFLSPKGHLRYHKYVCLKINSAQISETMEFIKKTWEKLSPESRYEYHFLDETIGHFYQNEQKMGEIFNYFTIFAIFISCLGLLGLVFFTVEQRTKEIGIRKVMGASTQGITFMLIREFSKWVLISNIIAWPAAYLFINSWLNNFAYKIKLEPWIFLTAGAFAFFIAAITISIQAVRAAISNPVNSLRYE